VPLISESGLKSVVEIKELATYGFKGFLMGEAFMKELNPKVECTKIINQIKANNLLIKICGIKTNHTELLETFKNESHSANLLGFISHPKSSRYIDPASCKTILECVPSEIGKVLVSVDLSIEEMSEYLDLGSFTHVQLHGEESTDYIKDLKSKYPNLKIIKAVSVGSYSDFDNLDRFEDLIDLFLFDSKGPLRGGNGTKFSWDLLDDYKLNTPFFLSGGIRLEDIDQIKEFSSRNKKMIGIDVNSGFESEPGIKDLEKVKKLLKQLV